MTAQFLTKWLTIHNSNLVCSALDSRGAEGARSPLEFWGSEMVIRVVEFISRGLKIRKIFTSSMKKNEKDSDDF